MLLSSVVILLSSVSILTSANGVISDGARNTEVLNHENNFARTNPDALLYTNDTLLNNYKLDDYSSLEIIGANIVQEDATKLTVWIRAGGNAIKSEISSFVRQILEKIPQNITAQILICTNEGDTILEELDTLVKVENRVKVIFSHLNSFSTSLSVLAKNTDPESNVLSLSVGVNIRQDQIETGLSHLRGRVQVYGWTVSDHGNDGSVPGKGWYNTAALIDKIIVRQMVEEGVPKWVDNGVLGMIGQHTIGGNEEIPIMVKALQRDPKAKFILNVNDPVSSSLQLGTGISFQEKLKRKVVVGLYYMQKLYCDCGTSEEFESWQKNIWKSIEVI